MSDPQNKPEATEELPRAKVKRRKWEFPFVWAVPVIAAAVAGYLVFQRVHEFGPEITIQFSDVDGIKPGQTQIKYRGVNIGEVTKVELSKDLQHAAVKAHLKRAAGAVARERSLFWIVRPEVGIANISGLGTIISGPHIEVLPGDGESKSEFAGLEHPPVTPGQNGLALILLSAHLGALKPGSPVYYRGIEVGAVEGCQLSTNAITVDVRIFIEPRYTNLVRESSKFWNASGLDMKFGLFRGAEINVESLKSLLSGGIAFATPNDAKVAPVANGTIFALHDEPKKEWLEWSTEILVPAENR